MGPVHEGLGAPLVAPRREAHDRSVVAVQKRPADGDPHAVVEARNALQHLGRVGHGSGLALGSGPWHLRLLRGFQKMNTPRYFTSTRV